LFTDEGVLGKDLTVLLLVVKDLLDTGLEGITTGEEEVLLEVDSTGDIDLGVLDSLGEADNHGVVLRGSHSEVLFKFFEGGVEVGN